jgi:hypothetical protein
MHTLCPICGQRNDTTAHTCWVQTIAPTAWNNHHEIRTDNTAVIIALEARIALLEAAAQKVVNCLGVWALWSCGEVATAKEIRKLEAVLKQEDK